MDPESRMPNFLSNELPASLLSDNSRQFIFKNLQLDTISTYY